VSPSGPRKLVCLPHAKSEKTVVTITADAAARACPCNLLLGPEQAHTRCSTANHHHHDQYGPMYNSSSQLRPSTPPAPSLHERWRQGEVEARKRWRRPHPSQEEVEEARSEPSAIRTVIKNRSLPPPPRHTHTHAGMHIYRIPATSSADRRFPHYRDIGRRGHARHKRSSRVQQRGFLPALRNVCQVWQSESENIAFKA
jgi:hypothetical protein